LAISSVALAPGQTATGNGFIGEGRQMATSVPEPSTWAMLLAGFAGLGFAGWRARRSAAQAA
jgi:outer membrane lipase/esterase